MSCLLLLNRFFSRKQNQDYSRVRRRRSGDEHLLPKGRLWRSPIRLRLRSRRLQFWNQFENSAGHCDFICSLSTDGLQVFTLSAREKSFLPRCCKNLVSFVIGNDSCTKVNLSSVSQRLCKPSKIN